MNRYFTHSSLEMFLRFMDLETVNRSENYLLNCIVHDDFAILRRQDYQYF